MLKVKENERLLKELIAAGYKPLTFSTRNLKYIPNAEMGYLIWNLPARITCPYSTEHCRELCYAIKAELAYPSVRPSRMRHLEESKADDFVYRMLLTILKRRKYMRKKELTVRIHESGDFYSEAYAEKWLRIAHFCEGEDIVFKCYTKSFRFFDGKFLPSNFRLRASVWDDTPEEDLEIIRRNGWPIYTAVPKFHKNDGYAHCRCKDCSTCKMCENMKIKRIACEIH